MTDKKVAIMQPYAFPYIGYFQLIKAVDTFVFYDDVNFIKGGWINRNNILVNGQSNLFTIPLEKASQNILIKDIKIENSFNSKIIKTIERAYSKAPYFVNVFPIIQNTFNNHAQSSIANFAIQGVIAILSYLNIKTEILISSIHFQETKGLEKAERLIQICKKLNANTYINAIGGQELYNKKQFAEHNINLYFLKSKALNYKQFHNEFIPWLSIIDILMFNDKEQVVKYFNEFELL